jgi:predicted MFS family arabinose efflux permease
MNAECGSLPNDNGAIAMTACTAKTPVRGLSPAVVLLFAVACGSSVAKIYYAQPLLDAMARDFAIAPAAIGIVMTITQIGYALGLLCIVPLGDLFDRRRLIAAQSVLSAIALFAVGYAPNALILLIGLWVVGLLAVVVQVIVAFAAALAAPDERGKVVGTVTSGVVIGILLARFISGVIADFGGWRLVYCTSAVVTLCMALVLYRVLPKDREKVALSYRALLGSLITLFREEPILRRRAIFALVGFAAFGTFWTPIVLPLSAPPFSFSHSQIGLLGLVGVAGALAAGGAGRLADRGHGQRTTGIVLALTLLAWALIAFLPISIWPLILGVIVLDLAVQALHVTNQSMIFVLRPEAGSRMVAGYMVFYSIGSGSGSIAATLAYGWAGWTGVSALGFAISLCGLVFWLATRGDKQG